MHVRVIWVGKTKNEHIRQLANDYLCRLARFTRCEVREVRESSAGEMHRSIEEEGKRIASLLPRAEDGPTVLLDIKGQQWSSEELAAEIERWQNEGRKEVAFVIGGHFGVSLEVQQLAALRWSLSRLTLTHEMARVVLTEQLYRAYTIIRGLPYQK